MASYYPVLDGKTSFALLPVSFSLNIQAYSRHKKVAFAPILYTVSQYIGVLQRTFDNARV